MLLHFETERGRLPFQLEKFLKLIEFAGGLPSLEIYLAERIKTFPPYFQVGRRRPRNSMTLPNYKRYLRYWV